MEAVFRPENFRIFSDNFRLVPAGKHRKSTGIHRKKSRRFPVGILLPCSSDFRCFPAGSGDFPASSLQDPGGSGGRNHRPGMSTYAGIVYLEQSNPSDHQHFISYTRDYHQQLKMYIPGDSIRYRIRYRTDRNPIGIFS